MKWFGWFRKSDNFHDDESFPVHLEPPSGEALPEAAPAKDPEPTKPERVELGVESLYLPFGVSKGWADTVPLDRIPIYEDALVRIHKPLFGTRPLLTGEFAPADRAKKTSDKSGSASLGDPNSSCYQLLYTSAEQNGDPNRVSFCDLPAKHEGKHGKPGIEYLHPDEYPNRVGSPLTMDARLRRLANLLTEASGLLEELRESREL